MLRLEQITHMIQTRNNFQETLQRKTKPVRRRLPISCISFTTLKPEWLFKRRRSVITASDIFLLDAENRFPRLCILSRRIIKELPNMPRRVHTIRSEYTACIYYYYYSRLQVLLYNDLLNRVTNLSYLENSISGKWDWYASGSKNRSNSSSMVGNEIYMHPPNRNEVQISYLITFIFPHF